MGLGIFSYEFCVSGALKQGIAAAGAALPARLSVRSFVGIALAVFVWLGGAASVPGGTTLYVSLTGNDDAWSGTVPEAGADDGPFATLTRARDEIRRLTKDGKLVPPATVYVRGGRYELTEAFMLTEDDSGTLSGPVTYRAFEGETPILSGGRQIDAAAWSGTTTDVVTCDLKALGLENLRPRDLYFSGQRQHLARRPNFEPERPYAGGFSYVAGDPVPMYEDLPDEPRDRFRYQAGDVGEWAQPDQAEVVVFPRFNWRNDIIRIAGIDYETGTIKLAKNASYAIRPGDRYYIQNLLEELDAPGEWYWDAVQAKLHFWAPTNVAFADVVVPVLEKLVVFANARYIVFQGFTLEAASSCALFAVNGRGLKIAGNVVRNIGGLRGGALVVGGTSCTVEGNDVYDVGAAGIVIRGGDRSTLEGGGNVVANNHVYHVGRHSKREAGILCNGVGNRVANNLVHDCPRAGIAFSGNDHIIEKNHVRHVCLETTDTAGIYTFAAHDIARRGHIVRHNLVHDVLGFGRFEGQWVSPYYAWGIYLDGGASGVTVTGNICARMPWGGGMMHGGYDNLWENNIFVDGAFKQMTIVCWNSADQATRPQAEALARSRDRKKDNPFYRERYPGMFADKTGKTGNTFVRNIISYREPYARLYDFHYVGEDFSCNYNLIYHFAYPIITGLNEYVAEDQWDAWQKTGMDAASQLGDPLFAGDEEDDSYRLKPESPAFELGFKAIPVDEIGLYESDTRASWPPVEGQGVREQPIKADRLPSPKPPAPPVHAGNEIHVKGIPTCRAMRTTGRITVDGFRAEGEWPGKPFKLRQTSDRREILGPPVLMQLAHDGSRLFAALDVRVPDASKLRTGGMWGTNDGFEICFKDSSNDEAPTYVVKCYAGGKCQSTTAAGATPEQAATLQEGLEYVAQTGTGGWGAELSIPLADIGIRPEQGLALAFNVGVRRVQTREWVLWVGTNGETWAVDDAGVCVLQ